MSELGLNDFAAFFRGIHNVNPFPWQEKLAERVVTNGWDSALDVPTGAGKTAAIDIAVFHLALEATLPTRCAALRIFFVVDRRLVVDDAFARAEKIAKALASSDAEGVVRQVADRLRLFEVPTLRDMRGSSLPLHVTRLRGGAPSDPDWVRTPSQPTVVVSTVDQVGSRLLFRGYGVSDSMKPVHAGLLGSDALYLLDEAHLSQPFVTTVKDAFGVGEEVGAALGVQPRKYIGPFQVVTLSATQNERAQELIAPADYAHPILGPRLRGSKPASLVSAKVSSDDPGFVQMFVDEAWRISSLGEGNSLVVGIVVNRVKRARQIFQELRKRIGTDDGEFSEEDPSPAVALLIGRTRELDREALLGSADRPGLLARMSTNRTADEAAAPLIVVATQCIEAGADLDFDGLVSEIAPLDCLRQRFGRLNRAGRAISVQAAILAAADQIGGRAKPDVIYGYAPNETWRLLESTAAKEPGRAGRSPVVDFGIVAAKAWVPEGEALKPYLASGSGMLVLMPAFVERWTWTSPRPVDEPEVALFLHGQKAGPPDIQIVWRGDLEYATRGESNIQKDWIDRVGASPPSSLEALTIPYAEALRWLRNEAHGDVADVEQGEEPPASDYLGDYVLRWRGADDPDTKILGRKQGRLRPGDMIVVPASRGGCDRWGWNPESDRTVTDLADEANQKHRDRMILRLSPALVRARLAREPRDFVSRAVRELGLWLTPGSEETDGQLRKRLPDLSRQGLFAAWFDRRPKRLSRIEVVRDEAGQPLALEYRLGRSAEDGSEATTEDDRSVRGTRRSVDLRDHSNGVHDFAKAFAERARLSDELVADVSLAAFLHDAGKARKEFKLWLYNGDEIAALDGRPLAKSAHTVLGPMARAMAGLPDRARHEVASLSFAANHPALKAAHDSSLVLWLIGTHHGFGRPFFTGAQWPPSGETFEVDLGDVHGMQVSAPAWSSAELQSRWMSMRQALTAKYGPWGLARLESILRLADHRRSEWEQRDVGEEV